MNNSNTSIEDSYIPERQIRALYDHTTIRVYQAYSDVIAHSILNAGRFIAPPFKLNRMTWIKPSFLWMMYRCGWAIKLGQTRILAIDITREGFEWALAHSCLSHFDQATHGSYNEWYRLKELNPVRVQWDPERDILMNRLKYRCIQVGLSGNAIVEYMNYWTVRIEDITDTVVILRTLDEKESKLLPIEHPYPLKQHLAYRIGLNVCQDET